MKRIFVALMCVAAMKAAGFTAQAQKKAPKPVVIELNFRNADDTGIGWPFVEKRLSKTADVKECTLTDKETGYLFKFKANNPIYVNTTNGLMGGGLWMQLLQGAGSGLRTGTGMAGGGGSGGLDGSCIRLRRYVPSGWGM